METKYIDLLIGEFTQRKNANPRYSERAFAGALGLFPGYLKLLFHVKKRISITRAQDVIGRLVWK